MVKVFILPILIFFLSIPASFASPSADSPPCIDDLSDFQCFQQNLQSIYETNNELFWKHWKHHETKAKSYSSLSSTSQFISLVKKSDGELAEAMAEFIETMILDNIRCLLGAAEKLDGDVMEHLIRYYIMTPLYHEPSETLPIIEKELQKDRYSRFNKLYFNIRKSGR